MGPRRELQKLMGHLSTRRLAGGTNYAGGAHFRTRPSGWVLVVLFPNPTPRSIHCGPLDLAILSTVILMP